MSESRHTDFARTVLKPTVGTLAGWLYFVPRAITQIMHDEHIEPRVQSVQLRLGEFWNSIGIGGWDRKD